MAWSSANIEYFKNVSKTSYSGPQAPVVRVGGYQYGPTFDLYYAGKGGADRAFRVNFMKSIKDPNDRRKNIYLPNETLFIPTKMTKIPQVDAQKIRKTFRQTFTFGQYTEHVARMMLRKFAEVAAKFSPPNIGKATIEEKYYYRPIYKLDDLAKGLVRTPLGRRLYATKEDYAALRAGMKFKIMNTKYRVKRGTVYAYAKGINEAKRLSRIQNRGLTKYSWGSIITTFSTKDIQGIGQKTKFGTVDESGNQLTRTSLYTTDLPPIFSRLERKSPNIKKYRWGFADYKLSESGRQIDLTIQNRLAEVERYSQIAIRQGCNAAVKEVRKLIGYIQQNMSEKLVANIQKMFKFELFRANQVAALTRIKERTLENYPPSK